jgi:hypothetical protein
LYLGIIVVIAAFTASIALTFTAMENRHNAKAAGTESNSSSTIYIDAKPCVTTICINNQPCHAITSNFYKHR